MNSIDADGLSIEAEAWADCLAKTWAAWLSSCELTSDDVVLEIGPGYTDKIGRALASIGFSGEVHIIEPTDKAREWVVSRYKALLPEANVVSHAAPLSNALKSYQGSIDVILMNHVLDDLATSAILPHKTSDEIFRNIYPESTPIDDFQHCWTVTLSESNQFDQLADHVVAEVQSLYNHIRPRLLGINQYDSWTLTHAGLDKVNSFGQLAIEKLGACLPKMQEAHRDLLLNDGWDPSRWLLIRNDIRLCTW